MAIFVTDGFEQAELTEPKKAFDEAGTETQVLSPKGDHVRESWPDRRDRCGQLYVARGRQLLTAGLCCSVKSRARPF